MNYGYRRPLTRFDCFSSLIEFHVLLLPRWFLSRYLASFCHCLVASFDCPQTPRPTPFPRLLQTCNHEKKDWRVYCISFHSKNSTGVGTCEGTPPPLPVPTTYVVSSMSAHSSSYEELRSTAACTQQQLLQRTATKQRQLFFFSSQQNSTTVLTSTVSYGKKKKPGHARAKLQIIDVSSVRTSDIYIF